MLRTALIWGSLAGIIMIAPWFLFPVNLEDFDPSRAMIIGFAIMIIAFGTSYFGVKARKQQSDNWGFGKAWGTSASIAFIGMCIYVAGWMVYNNMHPEFIEGMFANSIESIQQNPDLTEAEKAQQLESIEWQQEVYENPVSIALMTFVEPIVPAFVISLIVALMLKSKKEDKESAPVEAVTS